LTDIRYTVSEHSEEEKKASSDLITECFDYAMGIAYKKRYDWQFLANPAGNGSILMAYDGYKAVGQIASIPCRYIFLDRHILTAIAGEWLCVSPRYRGKGIMSELIRRRLEADGNPHPFVLDLPNDVAMKGFLKSGYHQMSMELLVRPLKFSKSFAYKKIARVILTPFDGIWKRKLKEDNSVSTVEEYTLSQFDNRFNEFLKDASTKNLIRQFRNSEFLNWRYANVPGRSYKAIISTGDDSRLNGYIIIRIANAYGINVGFIMDLVTNEKESERGRSLIRSALEYFWNQNVAVAAALCFPNCVEYRIFKEEGFFICPKWIRPNPFVLCMKPSNNIQDEVDKIILMDSRKWFFMFGDFQVF
jgi:GNAT superfamily N-acetyltransferase